MNTLDSLQTIVFIVGFLIATILYSLKAFKGGQKHAYLTLAGVCLFVLLIVVSFLFPTIQPVQTATENNNGSFSVPVDMNRWYLYRSVALVAQVFFFSGLLWEAVSFAFPSRVDEKRTP